MSTVVRVIEEKFDDIDGSEATETINFAVDGIEYEIDVSDEHKSEWDKLVMVTFVSHARRVKTTTKLNMSERRKKNATIRKWAIDSGFRNSDVGIGEDGNIKRPIPRYIRDEYEKSRAKQHGITRGKNA